MVWGVAVGEGNEDDVFLACPLDLSGTDHAPGVGQQNDLEQDLGMDGVVIGFLTPVGEIDVEKTTEIVRLARPMSVTFHRAFDMCKNPYKALEKLIDIGINRVLTSGQKNMAPEGIDLIAELVKKAGSVRLWVVKFTGWPSGSIIAYTREE